MEKDYIDMIVVTNHDPKIIHAVGNVVDVGPRNCCNTIINRYFSYFVIYFVSVNMGGSTCLLCCQHGCWKKRPFLLP